MRLFDTKPAATRKLARNLTVTGLDITVCASADEAVARAQIITTCTADKRNAQVLSENMVGSGVHINAIGGDSPGKTELAADILHRADIFVELPEQTRMEGEIQQLLPDHRVTEFWQVLTGAAEGRKPDDQFTLFDSVGFAIEDFAVLRLVKRLATKAGLYTPLDMLADPDDPRDQFGMLMRAKPKPVAA